MEVCDKGHHILDRAADVKERRQYDHPDIAATNAFSEGFETGPPLGVEIAMIKQFSDDGPSEARRDIPQFCDLLGDSLRLSR
jgi:hypothetical protein